VYKRVLKEGRAIQPETPAEALHELRKTCKKLRYLMEFFMSLYPTSEIKALIKVLKNLQDNLGEFQDYEVQVSTLKQFSQQMMAEGNAPAETLMAMGILVEDLNKRQHQARDEFAARFEKFSLPDNQKHFRALFAYKSPETLAS
jgi:CHAD domain-containing protein